MPTYAVHHKIDTLLELWEPFEFDGFGFRALNVDWTTGRQNGWLALKTIDAETLEDAFRQFTLRFYPLVDRIAFIGQCNTTAELQTFIIAKPEDRRFFLRHSKKRQPVPLHFNAEEIQSLAALEKYEEKGDVFRYLREATNATSFYTMFAMLVSALEAMAGVTDEKGRRKTNHQYIAEDILRDKLLYKTLFKYGEGIRNQIFHGGALDAEMHGDTDYNGKIREAIIDYFNDRHGLKIDRTAAGRPRTISGTYTVWGGWCEWVKDDVPMSLELLSQKYDAADAAQYYRRIDKPDDF